MFGPVYRFTQNTITKVCFLLGSPRNTSPPPTSISALISFYTQQLRLPRQQPFSLSIISCIGDSTQLTQGNCLYARFVHLRNTGLFEQIVLSARRISPTNKEQRFFDTPLGFSSQIASQISLLLVEFTCSIQKNTFSSQTCTSASTLT